jgi:hypothetical protein
MRASLPKIEVPAVHAGTVATRADMVQNRVRHEAIATAILRQSPNAEVVRAIDEFIRKCDIYAAASGIRSPQEAHQSMDVHDKSFSQCCITPNMNNIHETPEQKANMIEEGLKAGLGSDVNHEKSEIRSVLNSRKDKFCWFDNFWVIWHDLPVARDVQIMINNITIRGPINGKDTNTVRRFSKFLGLTKFFIQVGNPFKLHVLPKLKELLCSKN